MIDKILPQIKSLSLLGFIVLTLSLPLSVFGQEFGGFLASAVLFIPTLFIAIVLGFFIIVSGLFMWIGGLILDWIISPSFVSLSYTRPCPAPNFTPPPPNCNPIVGMGLNITESFVNLILVVFMVVIALSIALRIGEYGSKKTFAKLILVALLVKFVPVFVGLVVDASNIVMNFFLQGIGVSAGETLSMIKSFGESAARTLFQMRGDLQGRLGLLGQGLSQIFLNIAMFLAFFLFAGIFLLRYLVLWTITILAPLAFVAWILPATKRLFDMWLHQLVQWSFIGIPIAFFLYLGMNSFVVIQQSFVGNLAMPGIEEASVGWFNQIFPFLVIIIFLYLGFTLGITTSAMGAAATIALTKRGGAWIGNRVGVRAARGAGRWFEERLRLREKFEKGYDIPGLSKIPYLRKMPGVGYIPGVQQLERVPGLRVLLPESARKYAEHRPAIEEAATKASAYNSKELARRIAIGADYGTAAVGNMIQLVQRGDFQDYFNEWGKHIFKEEWGTTKTQEDLYKDKKFQEKTGRLLQIAFQGGYHQTLLRSDPRLARLAFESGLKGYSTEELQEENFEGTAEGAVRKATKEARSPHRKNWEREVILDKTVVDTLMEEGRDVWEDIPRQIKRGQETALGVIAKLLDDFKKANEDLASSSYEEVWDAYKAANPNKLAFFSYIDSLWARNQGWAIPRTDNKAGGVPRPPRTAPSPVPPSGAAPDAAPPTEEEAAEKPATPKEAATKQKKKRKRKKEPPPETGMGGAEPEIGGSS